MNILYKVIVILCTIIRIVILGTQDVPIHHQQASDTWLLGDCC